ncbi:MAG: hypothetical protein PWQ17_942 [Anaerophaga sp.]|nr:hypothetical protein [Anaerophaga sp.]MDN5290594.1 hypothetical protein [Anaerophaga sp.]
MKFFKKLTCSRLPILPNNLLNHGCPDNQSANGYIYLTDLELLNIVSSTFIGFEMI